jgi:hypothetical protein
MAAAADRVSEELEEKIPVEFICPITLQIMEDPVFLPDGNSYERTAIEAWLKNNNTTPLTNIPLPPNFNLITNRRLKEAIERYKKSKEEIHRKGSQSAIPSAAIPSKPQEPQQSVNVVGLSRVSVPIDGHCFYNAVALYLKQDVRELRQMVATNLEHNIDKYRPFFLSIGRTVEDYIEAVRSTNEWAGDLEINILIRLLDRPIISVGSNGKIINRQILEQSNGEPIFVYYDNVAHYDGMVLQAGYTAKGILDNLLQEPQPPILPMAGIPQAASAAAVPREEKRDDNQYQAAIKVNPVELSTFLNHVIAGQQDEAEAMLKINPALALAVGNVTDHAYRRFHNITGFQYAVWALDWHMWTMIKKYLPPEAAKKQAVGFTEGLWVREYGECANLQTLLDTYQTFLDNYNSWDDNKRKAWYQQLGRAQRLAPTHVLQEFHDRPFYNKGFIICPDFSKDIAFKRSSLLEWYESSGEEPMYHISETGGRLKDVLSDRVALASLTSTRTQQRYELVAELRNSSVPRCRS